jgi:hypothetical protein
MNKYFNWHELISGKRLKKNIKGYGRFFMNSDLYREMERKKRPKQMLIFKTGPELSLSGSWCVPAECILRVQ